MSRLRLTAWLSVVAALFCLACDDEKEKPKATSPTSSAQQQGSSSGGGPTDPESPSAKEARTLASVLPPQDQVQAIVNSKGLEPYTGPTGTVRGVVRATGDAPARLPKILAKIEQGCTRSAETFGVVFREGKERALADVLVAVTGYQGYVPAPDTEVLVEAKGCAWDRRTVAMTYGQRMRIVGKDKRPYVPEILGQPMPAQLFVLPSAPTLDISPQQPGRFKLVDSMRLYNIAELFVLPYATVDVTDLSGSFEIKGIPTGPVKVNAFLPQTGKVVEKEVTIEEGKVLELEFELPFDRATWDQTPQPTPLDELPTREELRRRRAQEAQSESSQSKAE